ncbi:NAD(P)-binding Rossmann-fold superfamily protein [Striga hermonthica]|uniref:NAD(P)-binding Rossmann-fold superfamily protein n=1 Tax=Striga hermonthica TaxID=68872 RepID=A0A9N7RKS3_STRHE|nr:NAD(P)-binding Rossmann-fold superfamily protein [Striga hermonthica]
MEKLINVAEHPKKTEHLMSLLEAKERLHLIKANLLEEGSFDFVVAGCDGIFHTASLFYHAVKDPQAELIDPTLKGTLNVLQSVAKAPSVKRVVLILSIASVAYNDTPAGPETVTDETWWSDPEWCKKAKKWYVLSKTVVEEVAWKFVKEKDVALAHILAFENPSVNGRYLTMERVAHYSGIVEIMREIYPELPIPTKCADDKPFATKYLVSKERAKSLGIDFIPVDQGLK